MYPIVCIQEYLKIHKFSFDLKKKIHPVFVYFYKKKTF